MRSIAWSLSFSPARDLALANSRANPEEDQGRPRSRRVGDPSFTSRRRLPRPGTIVCLSTAGGPPHRPAFRERPCACRLSLIDLNLRGTLRHVGPSSLSFQTFLLHAQAFRVVCYLRENPYLYSGRRSTRRVRKCPINSMGFVIAELTRYYQPVSMREQQSACRG